MAQRGETGFLRPGLLIAFILCAILSTVSVAFADALYWSTGSPMQTARFGAASGVVNNKIYMLGGGTGIGVNGGPLGVMATVEEFDPSIGANGSWQYRQDLCAPRFGPGEAKKGNIIYVVAGYDGNSPTNTVLAYDVTNGTSSSIGNINTPRFLADTVLMGDTIYVFGGQAYGSVTDSIEAFDLNTKTSVNIDTLPAPRTRAGAVNIGNKIYIIGGLDGNYNITNTCWEYDPSAPQGNRFTAKSSLPISMYGGIRGATVINNKIYIAGGGTNNGRIPSACTANVLEYDPSTDVWELKASMPTARLGASAEILNNRLYALGGFNIQQSLNVNEYAAVQVGTIDTSTTIAGPGVSVCGVIRVNFPSGTSSGELMVSEITSPPSAPPSGVTFLGRYFDIATSAQYNGSITITVPYDDTGLTLAQENDLKLYHWNGSSWDVLPSTIDTALNLITGTATSLSPFVVGQPASAASPVSSGIGYGMNTNILLALSSLLVAVGSVLIRKRTLAGRNTN